MPRYLLVEKIPELLKGLSNVSTKENELPIFQRDEFQKKWCEILEDCQENAAVLSYRWHHKSKNQSLKTYLNWLEEIESLGYNAVDLNSYSFDLVDEVDIPVDMAVWMMWIYHTKPAKYLWIDQFCVPQDIHDQLKMEFIRDSPEIYRRGKVSSLISPVVDHRDGNFVTLERATELVQKYKEKRYTSSMMSVALKALMVNISYFRRVWCIQENVFATNLTSFPLVGKDVGGFQSLYVVDWPEFNQWNSLTGKTGGETEHCIVQYMDGNYTPILETISSGDNYEYLAFISKELMWAVIQRSSLVSTLRDGDRFNRAKAAMGHPNVLNARCTLSNDRINAIVPLIDYEEWKKLVEGMDLEAAFQAGVEWAYNAVYLEKDRFHWGLRGLLYNENSAGLLSSLKPKRLFSNENSLVSPARFNAESKELTLGDQISLSVLEARLINHPGGYQAWSSSNIWERLQGGIKEAHPDFGLSILFFSRPLFDQSAQDTCKIFLTENPSDTRIVHLVAVSVDNSNETSGKAFLFVDFEKGALEEVRNVLAELQTITSDQVIY